MPDRRAVLGTSDWRQQFEKSLAKQTRLARLTQWRSLSPGPPRFVEGNRAFYLRDGMRQLEWMLAAIGQAKKRVDFEMYIFQPDEVGKRLLDALSDAAKRGCRVRLLYDAVGSGKGGPAFFQQLIDAGGHAVEFNPLAPWRLRMQKIGVMQSWQPNQRDHRKLLVCDASEGFARASTSGEPPSEIPPSDHETCFALTGGRNVAEEYLGRPLGEGQWRDCGVVIFGPVGITLGDMFDAMWEHAAGEEVLVPRFTSNAVGDTPIMPVGSQPGILNLLQWTMRRLATAVRRDLRISCAYFIPTVRWRRTLAAVSRRGAACQIMIPEEGDVPAVTAACRHFLGRLIRAGIAIFLYGKAVLHEKTVIYDRAVTLIGSSNIDQRSFRLNYELSVVILGEAFADQVANFHEIDLQASERYTLEMWQARPLLQKIGDWFFSLFRSQL